MPEEIDFTICISCGKPNEKGMRICDNAPGGLNRIPCCRECNDSGKFKEWWEKTVEEIKTLMGDTAFEASVFTLNPLVDVLMLRRHKLQDQRLEDGVCPNGCSLLTDLGGGDWECPLCHFVQHYRKLS